MTTTDAVRRRMSASARRERIEAAAVEVFAEHGYDATALAAIAAAAGVTRTVLYDHFASKRDLYLHVLEQQNDAMLADVAAGIAGDGTGQDRLRSTIRAYLTFAHHRPAARRLLVDPIPTGDADLDRTLAAHRSARTRAVTSMLAEDLGRSGIDEGSTDAAVVVELLITGIDGVARWWQEHPGIDLEQVTEIVARMLWSGLPRLSP